MSDIHEGRCLCGHVHFAVSGSPVRVGSCHCRMCQKASGAAFLTLAECPMEQVTWIGAEPTWRASSDKAERGFCPKCGGAVSFRFMGAQSIELAVSQFDHPETLPPTFDIFTESAQPWVCLDPTLPHHKRGRE
jgi:hypothetical protein